MVFAGRQPAQEAVRNRCLKEAWAKGRNWMSMKNKDEAYRPSGL